MPMAGRGSRFGRDGICTPKPLIDLWGRPFFWWAAESARRAFGIGEMMFVVLEEHVRHFAIDRQILDHYPQAGIAICDEVTAGAAATARVGVEALATDGPILLNDSDHAFVASPVNPVSARLRNATAAALLTFESDDPAYSYARLDEAGEVTGTVEKQVVSSDAIAGAYLFAGRDKFLAAYDRYETACPYDEVYVSGIYNHLNGGHVARQRLERHISFGTPAELEKLEAIGPEQPWASWL
jgi:CTP:molybdopterin cytidylyltransferase MocA